MTTPEELELYRDREQSLIKHQFLAQYLQVAAFKTLQARSNIFNYVDAFAGPWNVSDESDYSDASFERALRMLEGVRTSLGRNGAAGLKIRFCLCEKKKESVARLREYAAKKARFEIHIFSGAFEENLDAIAKVIPNGFTFSFIDPTGWNVRNQDVFRFLRDRNGEFLLNFMSDHINRHAEYSKVVESFGRFLNDPDWAKDFSEMNHDLTNEEKVLRLLKAKMKTAKIAAYTPDFPIMVPRSDRIKMRLILGTHSEKGLEVFRDVEAKVQPQQVEVRDLLRSEGSKQGTLFSAQEHAANLQKRDGVGGTLNKQIAESEIKKVLQQFRSIQFGKLAPAILEEVPIRLTQLRDLLLVLRAKNVVRFDLPPKKKKPQDDTVVAIGVMESP